LGKSHRENLLNRNGTWYARLAIPRNLQASLGKREIVRSLVTKSLPIADRIQYTVIAEICGLMADAGLAYGKGRMNTPPKHNDLSMDALLADLKLIRRQHRMGLLSSDELENWKGNWIKRPEKQHAY
jgi:hypothetical protein